MALLTWDNPGGKERVRDKGTSPYNSETFRNQAMRILNQINSAVTVRHQHGHKAEQQGWQEEDIWIFPGMRCTPWSCWNRGAQVLINPSGNRSKVRELLDLDQNSSQTWWDEWSSPKGGGGGNQSLLKGAGGCIPCPHSLHAQLHFQLGIQFSLGFHLLENLHSQPPQAPLPSAHISQYCLSLPFKLSSWFDRIFKTLWILAG